MKLFFLTMLLCISMPIIASNEVIVKQISGETSWTISSIKELSFDGNGVKFLFTDNTSVYYSKETLNILKFNVSISGIEHLNETKQISITGNILTISGNTNDINFFSLDGQLVMQAKGSQVDISGLPNGAYIVKTDSLTTKIVKR